MERDLMRQRHCQAATPMVRLLAPAMERSQQTVFVEDHQQWQTFCKAMRLGYIAERGSWFELTDKGRAAIAKATGIAA